MFNKFENEVLNEYKENLKSDNSIKNIIKVFIDNYSIVNKNYNRDESADCYFFNMGCTIGEKVKI